jgi:hypothetical protein
MKAKIFLVLISTILFSCSAAYQGGPSADFRPLLTKNAHEIIDEVLKERNFETVDGKLVKLSNDAEVKADIWIKDEGFGIIFFDKEKVYEDRVLPEAAPGSKLHVLPALLNITEQDGEESSTKYENVYLFVLSGNDYQYHYNPTPDQREQVTFLEVRNRLIRDVRDFLSWYEELVR